MSSFYALANSNDIFGTPYPFAFHMLLVSYFQFRNRSGIRQATEDAEVCVTSLSGPCGSILAASPFGQRRGAINHRAKQGKRAEAGCGTVGAVAWCGQAPSRFSWLRCVSAAA